MSKWFRISAKALLVLACLIVTARQSTNAQHVEVEYISSTLWSNTQAIEVYNGFAYCAIVNGLVIFDVSNVSSPVIISQLYLQGSGSDITVRGSYAYIANYFKGLRIINISDPYNPLLVGSCETPGRSVSVLLTGNYAYVSNTDEGLQIINISNPINPILMATYSIPTDNMFIDGEFAYFGSIRLSVYNILDPLNPNLIGLFDPDSLWITGVAVRNNYAYLSSIDI